MKRFLFGFGCGVLGVILLGVSIFGVHASVKNWCYNYTEKQYNVVSSYYNKNQVNELIFDLNEFSDYNGQDNTILFCFGKN